MLNPQTTCPDCNGSGLVAGALCATCGGDGLVNERAVRRPPATAAAATTRTAAVTSLPGARAPERNDNADRMLRALVESGVSSQTMLDALQLIALGGAVSAQLVSDVDDVVAGLAERVAASARERLGVAAAADEPKRSKRERKS